MEILSEDEEFSIDLSKVKAWFKRKKKTNSGEKSVKEEFKQPESKMGIEVGDSHQKREKNSDKPKEIDGVEVKKEDKIYVLEKENKDEEAISLDFSKIKNWFKNLSAKKETLEKKEIFEKKEEDDFSFDVSKIKNSIKNIFKKDKKENFESKDDESLDLKSITDFYKKHQKWLIPLFLIIVAVVFSTYFRALPLTLPITDSWAEGTVNNYYKSQLASQIEQQYPNLPAQNKNNLVETEFAKFLESNKEMIEQQTEATSQQFKSQFKYVGEDGQEHIYLSDIDTYLWYGEVKNYLKNGHFGTEMVDGKSMNMLRNGREGLDSNPGAGMLHMYFEVYLYKFLSFFNRSLPLTSVVTIVSIVIIGLSIIPAFFIGQRIGGNLGGFFAAMVIAINSSLLSRTAGGVADTDPWNIFFPLMIMWLFLEAFEAKNLIKQLVYAGLSGLCVGLFAYAWGGWWYTFDFILGMIVLYLVYLIIYNLIKKEAVLKPVINLLATSGVFFLVSVFFVTIFQGFDAVSGFITGPFYASAMKEVAKVTLWPNVLTTVAEFNEVPLNTIISQMGGKLLFVIALIGIILTLTKKYLSGKRDIKYAIFLTLWFVGTAYGFTKGIRFAILMVPAFAIALGAAAGIAYQYLSRWVYEGLKVPAIITKMVLVIFFCLLLISPLKEAEAVANGEVILMNDAWYDSLIGIRDSNSADAIITSWWDFGHWFVSLAERRVTFDGADQGERIHWVGKSLLTPDENVSVGLLRMLNCGQEKPVHVLEEFFNGDSVRAVDVLNAMMVLNDKEKAIKLLKKEGLKDAQIDELIKITYCTDLIDQFYITSDDMIGKSGVWGHFGAWDFKKAKRYFLVHETSREEGLKILKEEFNLSETEAEKEYAEIQSVENADQWVSPWPGYLSGLYGCQKNGNQLECAMNAGGGTIVAEIDLKTMNTTIKNVRGGDKPKSIVYATKNGIEEKTFDEPTAGFSIVLIPEGEGYKAMLTDPLQAKSMFTQLFFFQGHGLECFDLFSAKRQITGGMIYVWKVDWDCQSKNRIYFLPKEEVYAKHLLVSLNNRTEEEALKLITEIKNQSKTVSFETLAKKYSDDPGSKASGGDLGWFGQGVMVPEFEAAAFNLKKGEISEPIKTAFGYHLIKLIDKREVEEDLIVEEKNLEVKEIEPKEENQIDLMENNNSIENQSKVFSINI